MFSKDTGNLGINTSSLTLKKVIIIAVIQIVIIGATVGITVAICNASSSDTPSTPQEKQKPEDDTPSGGDDDPTPSGGDNVFSFTYGETAGAIANPLKGYFSWTSSRTLQTPVAMEFFQINMIEICPTEDKIDLSYVDKKLEGIAERGHTAVMRFAVDDLGNPCSPDWFFEKADYNRYSRDGNNYKMVSFNDPYVLDTIEKIIKTLADKYDGDPRVAFWQLGTYGHWGEWHETYIDKSKRATEANKDRLMEMHTNTFKKTMLQVRRPEERSRIRPIGFFHDALGDAEHDADMDGFFDETETWDRWKTHAFGGDMGVSLQNCVFGEKDKLKIFEEKIRKYHCTYLMDSHFYKEYDDIMKKYPNYMDERNRIERLIGYNYYATVGSVALTKSTSSSDKIDAKISLEIHNKGLAPFYYDWMVNFALVELSSSGKVSKIVKEVTSDVSIYGILQDDKKTWSYTMKGLDNSLSNYSFALRIPSGVGTYVRLANEKQLDDSDGGWFIFAEKLVYKKE